MHFLRQFTQERWPEEQRNNSCVWRLQSSQAIFGFNSWVMGSNWKSSCLAESFPLSVILNLNIGQLIIVVFNSFVEIFNECL